MDETERWLGTLDRTTTRKWITCLPCAGGGVAHFYRSWELLPADVGVLPVRLPARDHRLRDPPIHSLPVLVEKIFSSLQTVPGSFTLFGHSFGGLLAYELAHRLTAIDKSPDLLVIAALPAPDRIPAGKGLHLLEDAEMMQAVHRDHGGIPDEVVNNPEWIRLIAPALRADLECLDSFEYTERTPLSCPILVLGGHSDRAVDPQTLEAWRDQTSGGYRSLMLDGDHFFVRSDWPKVLQIVLNELRSVE